MGFKTPILKDSLLFIQSSCLNFCLSFFFNFSSFRDLDVMALLASKSGSFSVILYLLILIPSNMLDLNGVLGVEETWIKHLHHAN